MVEHDRCSAAAATRRVGLRRADRRARARCRCRSRTPTPAPTPSSALFGEPGMPAAAAGWQRSRRARRCSPTRTQAAPRPRRCCWLEAGDRRARWRRSQPVDGPGLGAADAGAVRADGDHARLLDRADLARAAGRGAAGDPPRSRAWPSAPARTRRRACACAGSPAAPAARRAAGRACSTTAAARASWPSARRCTARGRSTRSTSTRRPSRPRIANARANGVVADRRPAGRCGAARYALVLANILATPLKLLAPLLCGHLAPGGDLVLAGILERQADELPRPTRPGSRSRSADRDDGWVLMTGASPGRRAMA